MGRKSTIYKYIGKKIGGIQILDKLDVVSGRLQVKCQCLNCSNEFIAIFHNVYRGNYKSCGCLQHAINKENPRWKGFGEISQSYFYSLKQGASRRDLSFEVNIEFIWNLFLKQKRRCAFTGEELTFPRSREDYDKTASLDRIDSSIGYTEDNVQWVHKGVNLAKQRMNNQEFLDLIKKIYEHRLK